MPRWNWVLAALLPQADWAQPPAVEVLGPVNEARDRRLSFDLRGPASAQWSMDGVDPHATFVRELTTDLFVWRDRSLIFRGRVGSCDEAVTGDGHTMSCSAVDYRGLLDRRLLLYPQTFVDWQPEHMAANVGPAVGLPDRLGLLQLTQLAGGGNLGIGYDVQLPALRAYTETFDADTKIGESISRFESYVDGFEWWIDPDPDDPFGKLTFHTRSWRGVERPDFPVVLGTTVDELRRSYDTGLYANHVIVRGGKGDKPPDYDVEDPETTEWTVTTAPPAGVGRWVFEPRWVANPLTDRQNRQLWVWEGAQWIQVEEMPEPWSVRDAGEWHLRPMGRLSLAVNNSELTTKQAVDSAADDLLADSLRPPAAYTCTLRPEIWTGPDQCFLGDRVPVYLRSGRLDIATTARVWTVDLAIDDETGSENVAMTLDQADPEAPL